MVQTGVSSGFWKRFSEKFSRFREELKKDSVASNPRKPVDCCNPPVMDQKGRAAEKKLDP